MGHVDITCPPFPQYRHKPLVSRLCRSADDNRMLSVIMGSETGSGGWFASGWHCGGVQRVIWVCSSKHDCIRQEHRMES